MSSLISYSFLWLENLLQAVPYLGLFLAFGMDPGQLIISPGLGLLVDAGTVAVPALLTP